MVLHQIKETDTPTTTNEGRDGPLRLGRNITYVSTERPDGAVSDQRPRTLLKNSSSSPGLPAKSVGPISLVEEKERVESTDHTTTRDSIAEFASIRVSVTDESCNLACRCRCHSRISLESSHWLTEALGIIFFRSIGTPLPILRSCNAAECVQQQGSSCQVTYHFPRWVTNRAFMLTATYRGFEGLSGSWSIGLPRNISASHKAWQHIQRHELSEFYKLLRQRSVFSNDMADDDGTPLLTVSTKASYVKIGR